MRSRRLWKRGSDRKLLNNGWAFISRIFQTQHDNGTTHSRHLLHLLAFALILAADGRLFLGVPNVHGPRARTTPSAVIGNSLFFCFAADAGSEIPGLMRIAPASTLYSSLSAWRQPLKRRAEIFLGKASGPHLTSLFDGEPASTA